MAKCQFCSTEVSQFDKALSYVIGTISKKNDKETETHIHGHLEDQNAMKEIVETIIQESGLTEFYSEKKSNISDIKEIVFHNRQRIGDMVMFTCAVRDFKKSFPNIKIGVCSTAMHIWDNNPHVDYLVAPNDFESIMTNDSVGTELVKDKKGICIKKTVEPGKVYLRIGPSGLTNSSNRIDWHFANAYRVSIEENLGVHIVQGESRGDIWFTEEEYNSPRVDARPYWIIVTGGSKGWGCKMYPTVRWQEVVDKNPDILFYQVGSQGDNHIRLKGSNVVDYIGKTEDKNTGLRDLFKLFLHAEGSIGLVSSHMHISGALKKPAVVVAGAREPVSFTRYAGHQYISNDGCLPCGIQACWHCDITTCTNLVDYEGKSVSLSKTPNQEEKDSVMPKCVEIIPSEEITYNLRKYYVGGRLKIGVISEKEKVNINKNPKPRVVAVINKEETVATSRIGDDAPTSDIYNSYGLTFNGGALTIRDWEFIKTAMEQNNIKTVLEFGAGLSTLLFSDAKLDKFVSYEDKQGWINKLLKLKAGIDIRLWNGKELKIDEKFDLIFVDGPSGDENREISTKLASELEPKLIVVHDAGREWAKKYQEDYIKPKYVGPIKGGHRCHLWIKQSEFKGNLKLTEKTVTPIETNTPTLITKETSISDCNVIQVPQNGKKFIKIVSTAKGYGGCARSVTNIMKLLLREGHKVEFIPFKNVVGSRELIEIFKTTLKDVLVTTNYNTVNEHCDIFFMYGDDYIWEFKTKEISDVFVNINADKKIMMLNYRRGSVGQTEWTKGWDKYMFLNSVQEKELLKLLPDAKTKVLASCVDLTEFFSYVPNYSNGIRIVRHSSQGDTKFKANETDFSFKDEVNNVLSSRPDVSISMLPGPSFIETSERYKRVPRTDKPEVIADFLSNGNLFWYSLPKGYMDMGPRVIMEAMAIGLPIIADNWGGAVDRVTPECGWLCNSKEEMIEIIKNVTPAELERKGQAAKQRAMDEFVSERWIKEIVG